MARYDHNLHYRSRILDQVPTPCGSALDIGCGSGDLARQLVKRSALVVGLDRDEAMIEVANGGGHEEAVSFIQADFVAHDFQGATFDFVTAVASLHHMDLSRALEKAAGLLEPKGVLAVLGLYRESGPVDLAWALAAVPVNTYLAARRPPSDLGHGPAPIKAPELTLPEVKQVARAVLPCVRIERLLLWRYLLTWRRSPN